MIWMDLKCFILGFAKATSGPKPKMHIPLRQVFFSLFLGLGILLSLGIALFMALGMGLLVVLLLRMIMSV